MIDLGHFDPPSFSLLDRPFTRRRLHPAQRTSSKIIPPTPRILQGKFLAILDGQDIRLDISYGVGNDTDRPGVRWSVWRRPW